MLKENLKKGEQGHVKALTSEASWYSPFIKENLTEKFCCLVPSGMFHALYLEFTP